MLLEWQRSRKGRVFVLAVAAGFGVVLMPSALASHTPPPTSVTIAGSLQSELGCPGDWQPDCALTHLTFDGNDNVWQGTFPVPTGDWEYKAALNDTFDENYGANAAPNGPNIPLSLPAAASVKFYYDHKTHWITDNRNSRIAVATGSFQSELGCSGDWDPSCLRSWLQDSGGDGTYTFVTTSIPAGSYEAKVAINESFDENYGAGGVPNGPNIPFSVPSLGVETCFSFDSASNVLAITTSCTPPPTLTISDVSANEGNSGTTSFVFTVGLSAPAPVGGVTFDIATADGTAQDDSPVSEDNDYVAQSLTGQTIPEGSSTYSFTVSVNGDTVVEPNETFFVNATNVTGATVSDAQGQGAIVNDDVEPYQILGFFSPAPKSKWKVGTTVPIKIALALNGTRISDPEAAGLLSPTCRVFFSAGATPSVGPVCMTYNALADEFRFNWKIAKGTTAPATITVSVTVKNADVTTNATLSEQIMLTK
jgi:hypothetical protein